MNRGLVRILIVDDHAILRRGLALVLNQQPDFVVVGEAENGCMALELVQTVKPHLVLLNLVMSVMDGVATAMAIRSIMPNLHILVLTGMELNNGFPKILTRFLASGIHNYVPKDASPDDLVEAIRTVTRGETYPHPGIATDTIAHAMYTRKHRNGNGSGNEHFTIPFSLTPDVSLTPREQEVLQWMATPSTYREIAEQLTLSEETVRCHAKKILYKLRQPNRFQAVLEAVRFGFIELSN